MHMDTLENLKKMQTSTNMQDFMLQTCKTHFSKKGRIYIYLKQMSISIVFINSINKNFLRQNE